MFAKAPFKAIVLHSVGLNRLKSICIVHVQWWSEPPSDDRYPESCPR